MSKLVTDECITSLVENHIGKENISDIGGGTLTGAISELGTKYIIKSSGSNGMVYEKYNNGKIEMYGSKELTTSIKNQDGALYFSDRLIIYPPKVIKEVEYIGVSIVSDCGAWAVLAPESISNKNDRVVFWAYAASQYLNNVTLKVGFHIIGSGSILN